MSATVSLGNVRVKINDENNAYIYGHIANTGGAWSFIEIGILPDLYFGGWQLFVKRGGTNVIGDGFTVNFPGNPNTDPSRDNNAICQRG